jgi:hypothetical protein
MDDNEPPPDSRLHFTPKFCEDGPCSRHGRMEISDKVSHSPVIKYCSAPPFAEGKDYIVPGTSYSLKS